MNYNYDKTFSRLDESVDIRRYQISAGETGGLTMSTDDTQPAHPPVPPPDEQSPPTVRTPAFRRPVPPPPPPAGPAGRMPATGTPPPAPGAAAPPAGPSRPDPEPTRREVPPGATVAEPAQAPYQQPGGQQAGYQPTEYQQAGYQQAGYQQAGYQQAAYAGAQQPQQPQYDQGRPWPPQDQPPGVPGGAGPWPPQDQAPGGPGQWPPAQPPGQARGGRTRRPRRRRMRRSVMALFTVIVLLILLVIADRVACAVAENEFASQMKSQGFPVKPSVDIEGFPFLNQLASKDFNKVDISASNVPAGPVTINSVHATINGLHISSFSSSASARVDHISATAFISFGSILSATGIGDIADVTVTQDGPNKLKLTADLGGVISDTEEAQITQTGPQTISVKLLDTGGGIGSALGSVLGSANSFSFTLPKGVPATLRITGLTLNNQGLTVSAAASNATFSQ